MPLYLACIEALDYPKSSIVLYIRTYDTSDATERLLREWVSRVGDLYGGVEFDVEIETRDAAHTAEIVTALTEAGYTARRL